MVQKAIVGEKVGMTQVWDDDNKIVPVTVVKVTPCRVVQVKTPENDGYAAIQVTVGNKEARKLSKPAAGHYAAAGVEPGTELVELRVDDTSEYPRRPRVRRRHVRAGRHGRRHRHQQGQGLRRRHEAPQLLRSEGVARRPPDPPHAPGSVGQCATPARVFKGTRMAGRMGGERVTTQSLRVVQADTEKNVVLVRGSVPGPKGGTVIIRNAVKHGADNGSEG